MDIGGVVQRFRWIQSGSFLMGSPESEVGHRIDEVLHHVTLIQGFWMADTACSQALWQVVMGDNPAYFNDNSENPVEQVSWLEVRDFLETLNQCISGKQVEIRLPSEVEWEYACRAGTSSAFSFGNDISSEQANYNGNYVYAGGSNRY